MDMRDVVCVDVEKHLVVRWCGCLMLAPRFDETMLDRARDVAFVTVSTDDAVQMGARPFDLERIVEGKLSLSDVAPVKGMRVALVVEAGAGRRFLIGWGDAAYAALGVVESRAKWLRPAGLSTFAWMAMHVPDVAKATPATPTPSTPATSATPSLVVGKTEWPIGVDDATLDDRTRKLKCLSSVWSKCLQPTADATKWAHFAALKPPFDAEKLVWSLPTPEALESFCFWYEQWFAGDREPLLRFVLSDGGFSATPQLETQLRATWERVHAATLDRV